MSRLSDLPRWPGSRFTLTPLVAIAISAALLIAAILLGLHNERVGKAEQVRQASVQAEILAASLAAPLAFEDRAAANEYLSALQANRAIEAAGVYDAAGKLVAGFKPAAAALPARNRIGPPLFEGNDLIVTARVLQGQTELGSVYLRTATESWQQRAARYLGIALIVVMASLLVAVLGSSYASLSEAHRALQSETEGRRKAEEQLRQAQKMEAMGQLTGGVAHDFNNLLMVASSGLDLMERTDDPEKRERLKRGIRQAVDRGAKLTQQLLTFARRSPMNPEVIGIADRIRGMHALLDRSLREDIVVSLDFPEDLWPVEVDASQLEVAVLNIALNARDAMPQNGRIMIEGRNRPGAIDGADAVELTIRDTGVGLSPDKVEKVFEPFFTTKGVGQGTGLGLSQVYGFARSSGGEVRFESELGRGTTVSLLIPRTEKVSPSEAAPLRVTATPAARRHDILLVEDDPGVAELVAEMLDALGYVVEHVSSADEAIAVLEADQKFDLVLSDMVMPGDMGGLDLVHEVGHRWPSLPAILMTGYSAAAASAGAEGVRLLIKPYRIEDLADEIESALADIATG